MDPPPEAPAPARKFQTRRGVQRTSKADREAFARAEELREAQARREAERAATGAARGSGLNTPRGRVGLSGTSTERTRNESGGGVFGAAAPGGLGAGRGRGRGRGANVEGLVGVKEEVSVGGVGKGDIGPDTKESQAGAGNAKDPMGDGERKTTKTRAKLATERKKVVKATKKDGLVILSSDEEGLAEEGPRRDIETIEISTDEDAEDGTVKGDDDDEGPLSATARGKRREERPRALRARMALRPVRAPRQARNSNDLDGFSERRKIQRLVKDKDKAYGGEDGFEGVPVDDDDIMDVDEPDLPTKSLLQSPESQTKRIRRRSQVAKDKDVKLASETIEERAERLRYVEDVHKLRHEFLAMPPVMAPTDGDIDMTEPDQGDHELASGRDGKMYLFQFPPLTPMLVDPAHKDDVVEIKQEPGAEGANPDHGVPGAINSISTQSVSKGKEKGNEKEKHPQIKKEDHDSKEEAKAHIAAAAERGKVLTADGARLPPGFAGKLNVHKSGKVTLEWGETNMEVRWGSEVDFLQDVVLATGDQGEDAKPGDERNAFALGQVQKKLVVIPDWQKIYE